MKFNIFGLNIESDFSIDAFEGYEGMPDISISEGFVPDSLNKVSARGVCFEASRNQFILKLKEIADFYVEDGKRVFVSRKPGAEENDIKLYLSGLILSVLLYQRGIVPLHATSVLFNKKTIVISGRSGAGKSTVSAAFYRKGAQIIADDVTPIAIDEDQFKVMKGYPKLKLWKDAIDKLEIDNKKELVRLRNDIEKFLINIESGASESYYKPEKVFILSVFNKNEIESNEIDGMDKFNAIKKVLYRRAYAEALLTKAELFRAISFIASKVQVIQIQRPQNSDPDMVMNYILERL